MDRMTDEEILALSRREFQQRIDEVAATGTKEEKAQVYEEMMVRQQAEQVRQQDEQDRMVGDALANRRFMERALKAVLANDKAEIRKIRQEHGIVPLQETDTDR